MLEEEVDAGLRDRARQQARDRREPNTTGSPPNLSISRQALAGAIPHSHPTLIQKHPAHHNV